MSRDTANRVLKPPLRTAGAMAYLGMKQKSIILSIMYLDQ